MVVTWWIVAFCAMMNHGDHKLSCSSQHFGRSTDIFWIEKGDFVLDMFIVFILLQFWILQRTLTDTLTDTDKFTIFP